MRAVVAPAALAAACVLLVSCSMVGPGRTVDAAVLAGPDSDGDGVRDDVAEAIRRMPVSPDMRAYLAQTAEVEQRIMTLDTTAEGARETAYAIAQEANRLISCVPATLDVHDAWDQGDTVQALVENTPERRAQVRKFSRLIDGRDFVEPTC